MRDRVLAGLLACGWLACVSTDVASLPECAPLEQLAPLPNPQCRAESLGSVGAWLDEQIADRAGPLLVRVRFDAASRVAGVCADSDRNAGSWSARRALGERQTTLMEAPAGPPCLAGRRLDLNRRAAKWADVRRLEEKCRTDLRTRLDTGTLPLHGFSTLDVVGRDRDDTYPWYCSDYEADWVLLDQPGSTRPLIFGKPEIVDPPEVRAYETISRCTRQYLRFEDRYACIESDGWERLD